MARALVGSLASFFLLAGTAQADSAGLGKVHFANSCSAAVQEKLQRAVAMLHSFYYAAATRAFQDIAAESAHSPTRVKMCEGMCSACGASGAIWA